MTGNLDVQGTVTADGLTVESSDPVILQHSSTGPTLRFNNIDQTVADGQQLARLEFSTDDAGIEKDEAYIQLTADGNAGAAFLDIMTGDGAPTKTARFSTNGDISFYEDTGSTPKMVWKATDERLGIGTSSPSDQLDISGSSPVIRLSDTTDSSYSRIEVYSSDLYLTADQGGTDSGNMIFRTNGTTERMRIDSSGNVGIGTSSPDVKLHVSDGALRVAGTETAGSFLNIAASNTGSDGVNILASYYGSGSYGPIKIWTGGSERMRITSTGNVGIGTSSPSTTLDVAGTVTVLSGSNGRINIGASNNYLYGDSSNNFIIGTAGSDKFQITSSGNVGIGTSSPSSALHVKGTSTAVTSTTETTSVYAVNKLKNNAREFDVAIDGSGLYFYDQTAASERMRIDSSGNLLVGKTSTAIGTAGTTLWGDGLTDHTRSGEVLRVNRLSTDGDIATFRKDGTTVGSIGSHSSNITIGTGATGLRFYDTENVIMPRNPSTGANVDGTVSLGEQLNRFKDLFLSGGVFLGGTGAANKLDDYEEGDFTANYSATGLTVTHDITTGKYTKVGNLVTFYILLGTDAVSGVGAVQLTITGLPFAPAAAGLGSGGGGLAYSFVTNENNVKWTISSGGTLNLWDGDSNTAGVFPSNKLATGANKNRLNIIGHYYAA
jgi:hypothetical protein